MKGYRCLAERESSTAITNALFVGPKNIDSHREHNIDDIVLRRLGEWIDCSIFAAVRYNT